MVVSALIISITALVVAVMALPTVLQMVWGRPRISLDLGLDKIDGGVVFECKIWNDPITNKFLKALHVRRMAAEDPTALFDVKALGSDRNTSCEHMARIRDFSGRYAQRVSLPCSPIGASFGIAYKRDNQPAKLFPDAANAILDVGKYMVSIGVIVDYTGIRKESVFEVNNAEPYFHWSD